MLVFTKLSKVFQALLSWESAGGYKKHLARLCAGWLVLLVAPPVPHANPLKAHHIACGAALLVLALLCSGPLIGGALPLLQLLGRLSGGVLIAAFIISLNAWRYFAGRAALQALRT